MDLSQTIHRLGIDGYQRPKKTYTDTLQSADAIEEKLNGYVEVDESDIDNISTGSFVRYIKWDLGHNKERFVMGGIVMRVLPEYIIIKGKDNGTFSAQRYTYNKKGEISQGGICHWCLQNFNHNPVLIPLIFNNGVYYGEGITCDFSCALAKAMQMTRLGVLHYTNSVSLLIRIFNIIYPDRELLPANDYLLLDCNGGSVPEEKWRDNRYIFTRTTGLVLAPIKVQYIMSDTSKE